jgi:hypothetical protein
MALRRNLASIFCRAAFLASLLRPGLPVQPCACACSLLPCLCCLSSRLPPLLTLSVRLQLTSSSLRHCRRGLQAVVLARRLPPLLRSCRCGWMRLQLSSWLAIRSSLCHEELLPFSLRPGHVAPVAASGHVAPVAGGISSLLAVLAPVSCLTPNTRNLDKHALHRI